MTRDVVIVGGGIAGLAAAWRLRHRDVLLLEASDRLGGRHALGPVRRLLAQLRRAPLPRARLAGRRDGARVRPRDRARHGLHDGARGGVDAARPRARRDVPLPAAALAARPDRVREGGRQGAARGRSLRAAPRLRGPPHVRRVPRPAAARRPRHLLVRGAPRDRGAGRALGRLRNRAVRARLGREGLADRAQPGRRERPAAGGARPRARRARAHRLPRARDPAGRRRPGRAPRRRRGRRARGDRGRAGAARRRRSSPRWPSRRPPRSRS